MFWITALLPAIKWAIIGAVTYFSAKPIINKFGSTPAARAEQLGIPREKLYDEHKKYREDKKKYMTERNEEQNKSLLEDIDKLKKEIEKLEKQKTKQAQEAQNESDPGEKVKKLALVKETDAQITAAKKEMNEKMKQLEKNNKELEKIFDDLGASSNLTEAQVVSKGNAPDLGAWKNWGIIAVVGLIAIFLVKMLFNLLKGVFKNVES